MALLKILLIIALLYLIYRLYIDITNNSLRRGKGASGENEIVDQLKLYEQFSGKTVRIYRNAYVTFKNGKTTEIDILALTNKYLYVIESKNYNGTVDVREADRNWSVTYRNGKVYSMYNPIMQNENHAKALRNVLKIPDGYMKRLVIFGYGTELSGENNMNVIKTPGLIKFIKQMEEGTHDMPIDDIREIDRLLRGCCNKDIITKIKHIIEVKLDHR